jgi:hypothetical protein
MAGIEYTTARGAGCAFLPRSCVARGFSWLRRIGISLEPLSSGIPGIQTRQFPFGAPSLELRRAPIHPGFAFGEHPVDQQCQVVGHGFDRRREGWQLPAQMTIPGSR